MQNNNVPSGWGNPNPTNTASNVNSTGWGNSTPSNMASKVNPTGWGNPTPSNLASNENPTGWGNPTPNNMASNVNPTGWGNPTSSNMPSNVNPTGWGNPNPNNMASNVNPTGWGSPTSSNMASNVNPTGWGNPTPNNIPSNPTGNPPPGWSLPTAPAQQSPANSKAMEANAPPSAPPPAHTGIYPPPPAYDSIFQNKQPASGQQNPYAPKATESFQHQQPQQPYRPPQPTTKWPPHAAGIAVQNFMPAQTFTQPQFYAQPSTFASAQPEQTKFYSQPTLTSGNSAPPVANMPLNTTAMGLNTDFWVPASQHGIPKNAFRAGHDSDGSPLFVCRAAHASDIIPGKAVPNHDCAYVAYGGYEHSKRNFEVLIGDRYRWVRASSDSIPTNAVEGGRTANGEKLYVGRASFNNSLTPGKVHPSHHCIYVPYGGDEKHFSEYEILLHA